MIIASSVVTKYAKTLLVYFSWAIDAASGPPVADLRDGHVCSGRRGPKTMGP